MGLAPINKFNYLKTLLDRPAAQTIQGLDLSATNLQGSNRDSKGPFWETQQIVSSHMDNLLKIPPCDDKSYHLRSVYDDGVLIE